MRGRLDEVVLGPRDLALEELLTPFVVDAREPAVELRERHELPLGEVGVRHVATVELVHPVRELSAPRHGKAQPVARAPGIRTQAEPACRPNVLRNKTGISLKAACGENRRLGCRLAKPNIAGGAHEDIGQPAWIEPLADGSGVARLVLDHGCAE